MSVEIKLRKQIRLAKLMNKIAFYFCSFTSMLCGFVGAFALIQLGINANTFTLLAGSFINMLLAQGASFTLKRLDQMSLALDKAIKENPEIDGLNLITEVAKNMRDI